MVYEANQKFFEGNSKQGKKRRSIMIYFTPLVDGSMIKELFSAYLKATKYKIPLKVNSVKLL